MPHLPSREQCRLLSKIIRVGEPVDKVQDANECNAFNKSEPSHQDKNITHYHHSSINVALFQNPTCLTEQPLPELPC